MCAAFHLRILNIRKAAFSRGLVCCGSAFGTASLSALPEKGTPAPPLDSLQLLQAPAGARADWASLKGKVVVLEFWATWCSPCVASLPHFNQLVESLDPAKFQFISIDDEDPKAVQTFLTRKKMSGWVGIDTSGAVFAWYGVKSRPTTIIVDGNGKIVAATEIDSVSAADLQAVAEGKSVTFKPACKRCRYVERCICRGCRDTAFVCRFLQQSRARCKRLPGQPSADRHGFPRRPCRWPYRDCI